MRALEEDRINGGFLKALPHSTALPLLLSIPHSGRHYPESLRGQSRLADDVLRSSEDAFVDHLFSAATDLGATTLTAHYARAYVDLNRAHDEIDSTLFDAPLSIPCRSTATVRAGLGVIPRQVGQGRALYTGRLPACEATQRLEAAYFPYHSQLITEIERLYRQFGAVYILDCHSMPSVPNRRPKRGGINRFPRLADLVLGDRWGTSAEANFTAVLHRAAEEAGFFTGRNHPYAGGFITRHYGEPAKNIHCVQLELCRDLYMDEGTITPLESFDSVKSQITHMITEAARYVAGQVGLPFDGKNPDLSPPLAAE